MKSKPTPQLAIASDVRTAFDRMRYGRTSMKRIMSLSLLSPQPSHQNQKRAAKFLGAAVALVGDDFARKLLEELTYRPKPKGRPGRKSGASGAGAHRVEKLAGYMLDAKEQHGLPWERSGMARKAAAIYMGRKRKRKKDPDYQWDAAAMRFMNAIEREMFRPPFVPPFIAVGLGSFGVLPPIVKPRGSVRSAATSLLGLGRDTDPDWHAVLDLVGATKNRAKGSANK